MRLGIKGKREQVAKASCGRLATPKRVAGSRREDG